MHVSRETLEETHRRLIGVLAAAEIDILEGSYAFVQSTEYRAPDSDTLACVRDGTKWSFLTRSTDDTKELCAVFLIHFPAGIDNSGFVGWLASQIKQRTGSGVFVICGSNSDRGGIYDYWGCPIGARDEVLLAVERLRSI